MVSDQLAARLRAHLAGIYGEARADALTARFAALVEGFGRASVTPRGPDTGALFDETDVVLIAYGDQVHEPRRAPLSTLLHFLREHTRGLVSGLHLLPHYPATSDDGFAVADFAAVDPALGSWREVEALASEFRLMLDAVLNHTSASHPWFTGWLAGDPRYAGFYLDVDPAADLAPVVRPRTTPLLTEFAAVDGPRQVWTTFGADQVDLDYTNPEVLLATTRELLRYVAHGAGMIRLDAVAFLWKLPGSPSIHLPQTHEIVRLWRTVLDAVAPGTLLVTETNVPHHENLTYFGAGDDEAHLVYQFALPPLTLAAFHSGSAQHLASWAAQLRAPSDRTTYLNFLASHDGIGVRAVEGIVPEDELDQLAAAVVRSGGLVSHRARPDGSVTPYELNSVFFDALAGPGPAGGAAEVDRFVAAHAILLALPGIPLVYFHSLFGSRNWTQGAERTGRARTINRQKLARADLEAELADPRTRRRQVLDRLLARLAIRVAEPAFHPSAPQQVVPANDAHLALQRTPLADDTTLVCVHDVSGGPGRFRARPRDRLPAGGRLVDLADGSDYLVEADGTLDVDVPPYGVRWLRLL